MFIFFQAKKQTLGGHATESLERRRRHREQIFAKPNNSIQHTISVKGSLGRLRELSSWESRNLSDEPLREPANARLLRFFFRRAKLVSGPNTAAEDLTRVKRGIRLTSFAVFEKGRLTLGRIRISWNCAKNQLPLVLRLPSPKTRAKRSTSNWLACLFYYVFQ